MQKKLVKLIHGMIVALLAGAFCAAAGLALWQSADLIPQRSDLARIEAMNAVLAAHKEEVPADASGPAAARAVLEENGYTDFSLDQRRGELFYLRNSRTFYAAPAAERSWYSTAALGHTASCSEVDLFRGRCEVVLTSLFSDSQYYFHLFNGTADPEALAASVGEREISLPGGEYERAALAEYFTHTLFYDGGSLFGYRAEGKKLEREAADASDPAYFGYELCVTAGIAAIPEGAFAGAYFTSVNLSDDVKKIGAGAFAGCDYLEEVTFPAALESIGAEAFARCRALYAADLPSGVSALGAGAFAGCEGLARLRIPRALSDVPEDAFAGCTRITVVNCEGTAEETAAIRALLPAAEGRTVRYEGKDYLAGYVRNVREEETLTFAAEGVVGLVRNLGIAGSAVWEETEHACRTVGAEGFAYAGYSRTVRLREGVPAAEEFAFFRSGAQFVTLPASLRTIGQGAFSGCYRLLEFFVAEENPRYFAVDGVLFSLEGEGAVLTAFPSGRSGEYRVPERVEKGGKSYPVTAVAPYAFAYAPLLTRVDLNGVPAGEGNFLGCRAELENGRF